MASAVASIGARAVGAGASGRVASRCRRAAAGSAAARGGNKRGMVGMSAVVNPEAADAGLPEDYDGPVPVVIIDNQADPLATILEIGFGDELEELLDTMQAIKNLGFNITKAEIKHDDRTMFYITDSKSSEKVTHSAELEQLRITVMQNMAQFHPKSAEALAVGFQRVVEGAMSNPLGVRSSSLIKTKVTCKPVASGSRTAVVVETTDRPGLLVDIVSTLKDLSLNVVSAEVDTIGFKAVDIIHVTYNGAALTTKMVELVMNSLTYFIDTVEEESY